MRPQVFRKRLEGRVDDMKLPRDVLEHGALLSGQLAWEEEPTIMRTSTSLAARAHPGAHAPGAVPWPPATVASCGSRRRSSRVARHRVSPSECQR